MIALLRGLPWWVYAASAVVLYVGVTQYQLNAANARVRAVEERVETAKIEELGAARAAVGKELADLRGQRDALNAAVRAAKAAGAQIAARLVQIDARLAEGRTAARVLIESGTVDEVLEAGKALGYSPLPAPRPR